ncbi:MAG TPA: beta-phosphoglucomutase family hydrolase [Jiangellaceae bacterium]|nr:beta-phosphoglucomutase family hydrolase [Jiangellaceae bacterium]
MEWSRYRAALFDLDGVITPTARVHVRAWTQMFDEFLAARGEEPFTRQDYLDHVDGKPRMDGVRDFLASRNITLPEGDPDAAPDEDSIAGLGNRKNEYFVALLRSDGVDAFPGSVALLDVLPHLGVTAAVVSSSRNARTVLEAAGLLDRFDVIVDGDVAAREDLAGKPEPDTYLAAAGELGVDPGQAVVVEDALSGVASGAAGGFGVTIGVDRGAGHRALLDNGADVVVDDLAELIP